MSIVKPARDLFPTLERAPRTSRGLSPLPKSPSLVKPERTTTLDPTSPDAIDPGTPREVTSFADRVKELMIDVNETQQAAEKAADDFAAGRSDDIHGTMVAVAKADVSLRLIGSLRNKAIEAYREIMRMGA